MVLGNKVNIKLEWEGKDKTLLYFEDDIPVWGELSEIKNFEMKKIYNYSNKVNLSSRENMLIKGDNILSLLKLKNKYTNSIKCVYIDPPFNTGKTFNHYSDSLDRSLWLSMMKIRLELLRDLLSDDGSIFVHIDDDEMPYLKVLMDEIFNSINSSNHVGTIIWQKKSSPQNDAKFISDTHDYILVYAKNIKKLNFNKISRNESQNKRYSNIDNDERGPWMSSDLTVRTLNPNYVYDIILPSGRIVRPSTNRSWGMSEERYFELVSENRIWYGKTGDSMPRRKRFLSEVSNGVVPKTIWLRDEVGDNSEGKNEIKKFADIPDDIFSTPKPERLLKKILEIATNENDLVLDAFLGSGTTCAVAHKMNRRWIGLENGEQIDFICANRLKKVIDGEDEGGISKEVNWQGGGGFQYYEISDC